jgi:hypothetical protein
MERQEPLGIDYRMASAVKLPFPDGVFDFATGFMSFMDILETELVLSEAIASARHRNSPWIEGGYGESW